MRGKAAEMARTLPVFLHLEDRPCLVVGGGPTGIRKARVLLEAGARVTVVDPRPIGRLRHPRLRWLRRAFRPQDVRGCALVVAATDSPDLQARVSEAARAHGVWCNVVDRPDACDVLFGAILRRGPFQIAVSTGGHFPLLASRFRDRLSQHLPPRLSSAVRLLGRARRRARRTIRDPEQRRRRLRQLLDEETLDLTLRGDLAGLRERVERWNPS
jgi:uroporphyrin-III C-methyltransferase/precorrin-2 dehydrogenase/sirohydrochlorin ferrochelatase